MLSSKQAHKFKKLTANGNDSYVNARTMNYQKMEKAPTEAW